MRADAPGLETHVIHEQAFGTKGQLEVDLPWDFQNQNHAWDNHVGDMTFGWKQVMYSNLRSGSIFSAAGRDSTADREHEAGRRRNYHRLSRLPHSISSSRANTWVQFQMGADLPVDTRNIPPRASSGIRRSGRRSRQDHRLGRQWSPMVEFLATRDLVDGAKTDWDIMPEMQVTLSRRQHVRANVGVRAPVTDTAGRSPQVYFYVLWDWAEGHFWNGW